MSQSRDHGCLHSLISFDHKTDICFCCHTGLSVNGMMFRVKAKELSPDPECKASLGWYSNWKGRHSISVRTKTSLVQRLPANREDKVIEFDRFVLRSRQHWGYHLSHTLNMDETPMRFELPATRTSEFTGSRTVPVLLSLERRRYAAQQ